MGVKRFYRSLFEIVGNAVSPSINNRWEVFLFESIGTCFDLYYVDSRLECDYFGNVSIGSTDINVTVNSPTGHRCGKFTDVDVQTSTVPDTRLI